MAAHNELGKEGELLAANHLQSEGYVIRHRNWRCGHKELDIVAEKDGTLVFVEVKTRKERFIRTPRRRRHKRENTTHCQFGRRLLAQIRHRPSGTLRPYHHRNGRKRASPAKAYRGRLLPAAILTATRLEYFEYDAFTLHTGRFAMV